MRTARTWLTAICAAAPFAVCTSVQADVSATNRNLAQSLFDQAQQLMEEGRYAEACPKLVQSQSLDPAGGTLLNLGLCYEKEGKFATAWAYFKEGLSIARRDNRPEREQAAEEHIASLEPKLARVTFAVAGGGIENERITLDDSQVGKSAWSVFAAVDPGSHEIVATAEGRKAWRTRIDLGPGERRTIAIPPLEEQLGDDGGAMPKDGDRPVAGYLVAGGGVLAIGVGTFFGLRTLSKRRESNGHCPTDSTCTSEGVSLNKEAITSAWIADAGIGLGVLGLGVGAYLIFGRQLQPTSAASTTSSGVQVLPEVGTGKARLTVMARW
jgi:hypothetical protein